MKILVAGGAGYIGSVLVPTLVDYGYHVDVVDLLWFENHLPSGVKVIEQNLFNITIEFLKDYDQVLFLAGLSNDPMAEYSPAKNFISNAALPSYLAYNAKLAGVKRFIYASSCSVYSCIVEGFYDENSPTVINHPYGISKLQGEKGVLQMQDNSFSVIALRQGTVCGYSPRMRFDLVVNTMFKTCYASNKINVTNPSIWRPILDIRDAVGAWTRAIQADYQISGVFNITSGNYTIGQLADLVKHELEKIMVPLKMNLEIGNVQDPRSYKVTTDKAKSILGFTPLYDIIDIIEDLFEHRNEYGDLEDDRYYNIRVFKKLEEKNVA